MRGGIMEYLMNASAEEFWAMVSDVTHVLRRVLNLLMAALGYPALMLIDVAVGAVGWDMNLPHLNTGDAWADWALFFAFSLATSVVGMVFWNIAIELLPRSGLRLRKPSWKEALGLLASVSLIIVALAVGVYDILVDISPVRVWMGLADTPGFAWKEGGVMYRVMAGLIGLLSGANEPLSILVTSYLRRMAQSVNGTGPKPVAVRTVPVKKVAKPQVRSGIQPQTQTQKADSKGIQKRLNSLLDF